LPEPAVTGITVQQVNGDASSIQTVIELYAPDVETMEGASFLMACRTKQLDCFQLRSISNMVEPRNKKNWNIPLAIDRLNVRLLHILSHLP
jgi:futalosine hydrolase